MRVYASVAAALLRISAQGSSINAVEHLEPTVQRHAGVLPRSVCKQLIDLGEEDGFLVQEESIDDDEQSDANKKYVPSQTIDVYERGSEGPGDGNETIIDARDIWNLLQPWIPKIKQIVKDNRNREGFRKFYPNEPDREPDLNWIFFRKYSPDDERKSLKHHHDTNMNTVNIELADDYEGGGLFYIKPLASTGKVAEKYEDYSYEWVDSLKRENTTELVFPDLRAGDAIFYNYTVEHGVAPVESGTRYSMAFFFDMDNPAVKDDLEEDEEDALDEDEFEVALTNGLDTEIDIILVYDSIDEKDVKDRKFNRIKPGEIVTYVADEGDIIQAVVSRTDKVVVEVEMRPSLSERGYKITDKDSYVEPTVKLHASVLSPSVCQQLIDLGENAGFLVQEESVDAFEQKDPNIKFVPSQTINIYGKGKYGSGTDDETEGEPKGNEDVIEIDNEDIWNVLKPWIPKITQIVKDNRNKEKFSMYYPDDPDREPELNWVFFRKYSPGDDRNSLRHHRDTNMNTVNIELSNDYDGGGWFYMKTLDSTGDVNPKYVSHGYDWIDSVERENTTDIVFPDLKAGDAIYYNFTVDHAVAPIESGTRYSMAFFFDMDNPAVRFDEELEQILKDFEENDDQFDVELLNGRETEIDLVWVYDVDAEEDIWEPEVNYVMPNETVSFRAVEGDKFRAVLSGTKKVVAEFEMNSDQSLYTVSRMEALHPEL